MRAADIRRLRIPVKGAKYYCKIWLELYDGGSGQWLYACRDGLAYIFIDIDDMVDSCGSDASFRWAARVCVVDLYRTPLKMLQAALQAYALHRPLSMREESDRLVMAEALFSEGSHAPLWSGEAGRITSPDEYYEPGNENGRSFRGLRKEAREYVEAHLLEAEARDQLIDTKVVNKIGQTAREYAAGTEGLFTALDRIRKAGPNITPEQRLVLQMYGKADHTLGGDAIPERFKS